MSDHNDQYGPASKFFAAVPQGTGAAGSSTPDPESTAGPVIGNPVVSVPYASSQVPANMPQQAVTSGDTSGMSSDSPVPASGDPLTGVSLADVTQTGAGQGSGHAPHPNSTARRPM